MLLSADVLTAHNDNTREGQNTAETILTPANVNPSTFGAKFTDAVDAAVYAQPLVMNGVSIPGQGVHNVVYVATANDSVYAFDADRPGVTLWHDSLVDPAAGVTAVPAIQAWQKDLNPEIGITGTPVIDAATNTMYVVAKVEVAAAGPTANFYLLYALDTTTGAVKLGGPTVIEPIVAGRGAGSSHGVLPFQAYYELQRPALLLEGGVVYVAFGSLGGIAPAHGWLVGYSASTLKQVAVFNDSPNASEPGISVGGIWMGGAGPAADAQGYIYLFTGSGQFNPAIGSLGDAALKLTPSLQVADDFAPQNTTYLDKADLDLGSGGSILVPTSKGSTSNVLVGGGKVGTLFSISTAAMGKQSAVNPGLGQVPNPYPPDSLAGQPITGDNTQGGIFTSPAYWNGFVYINTVADVLRQYVVFNGKLYGPIAGSTKDLAYPGANLSVSSNGASNGIVWSVENSGNRATAAPAVLHAYLATNVGVELYNSAMIPGRDTAGNDVKFAVPTVSGGEVFVGTKTGLTVYGLLG